MSDISLQLPLWFSVFVLSGMFWPVTLMAALFLLGLGFLLPRLPRVLAFAASALLFLDLGGWLLFTLSAQRDAHRLDVEEAQTHSTLAQSTVIDGLSLPKGTEVSWTDPSHAHVWKANLPEPTPLFGLQAEGEVTQTGPGGWTLQLAAPQTVSGWPCDAINVAVTVTGQLVSCTLATAHLWQGWQLPPGTLLNLQGYGGTVELVTPGRSLAAPEIGRSIPDTGAFGLNRDGSLHDVYFEPAQPYIVHGIALWNTVTWVYASASFGAGRRRLAIAVEGALVNDLNRDGQTFTADQDVSIQLADGAVTAR